MEKVYQNGNIWSVNDLADLYSFRCVNVMTGEETTAILSWKKGVSNSDMDLPGDARVYAAEMGGEEVLFVGEYVGGFTLRAYDGMQLERVLRETDISFVGEAN